MLELVLAIPRIAPHWAVGADVCGRLLDKTEHRPEYRFAVRIKVIWHGKHEMRVGGVCCSTGIYIHKLRFQSFRFIFEKLTQYGVKRDLVTGTVAKGFVQRDCAAFGGVHVVEDALQNPFLHI